MTISINDAKTGPLAGDGNTLVFTYDFPVLDGAHLRVILTDASGQETVLVPKDGSNANDYEPDTNNSTVSLTSAPATGETVTIQRAMPVAQETDFVFQSGYHPGEHEAALDRLTMVQQQQAEALSRAVKVGVASGDDPAGLISDLETARDDAVAARDAAIIADGNAASSASAAASSAATASTAESNASTSAANAASSQSNAAGSAGAAATSASDAAASAGVAGTKAAEAAASAASVNTLELLGRAKFAAEYPTIQTPVKVIDFTTGFGDSEIAFTRSTVNHFTNANRLVEAAGVDQPIFQHHPSGEPRGLYVSPARTRLNKWPTELFRWNRSSTVFTANDGPSPDGGNNSTRHVDNHPTVANGGYQRIIVDDNDDHYIFSIYVLKRAGAPCCRARLVFAGIGGPATSINLDPGTGEFTAHEGVLGTDCDAEDAGKFWRLWCRVQNNSSGFTDLYAQFWPATRPSGGINGPDVGTQPGHNNIWGALVEQSDVLAPVILGDEDNPLTIDSDDAEINLTNAGWFNGLSGEGTFLFNVSVDWARLNTGIFYLKTATGKTLVWRNTTNGSDFIGDVVGARRDETAMFRFSGTAFSGDQGVLSTTAGDHKVAVSWDHQNFTVSMDGQAPDTEPWSIAPEDFTELELGHFNNQVSTAAGCFGRIAYWPRKLSDADIQALTAV